MGSSLCEQCAGACCRYLAIEIDKPTCADDYDDIRWYLMHEGYSVFVEDGDWYLQGQSRCKNLGPDNRCLIYDTRPKICRNYGAGDCDYSEADPGYDHLFTHVSQIEEYYLKKTRKRLVTPGKAATARKKRARARTAHPPKAKNTRAI